MPTVASIGLTKTVNANAGGTGSVTFQNTVAAHKWTVKLLTATSLGYTVTVARNGVQVIDTTTGDPRPAVTSDSTYDLEQMESIVVSWTGAPAGHQLAATITYDDSW